MNRIEGAYLSVYYCFYLMKESWPVSTEFSKETSRNGSNPPLSGPAPQNTPLGNKS